MTAHSLCLYCPRLWCFDTSSGFRNLGVSITTAVVMVIRRFHQKIAVVHVCCLQLLIAFLLTSGGLRSDLLLAASLVAQLPSTLRSIMHILSIDHGWRSQHCTTAIVHYILPVSSLTIVREEIVLKRASEMDKALLSLACGRL
jgi:hypothetical protein